jgi:hypothetical protein
MKDKDWDRLAKKKSMARKQFRTPKGTGLMKKKKNI